jgi:hypothetical protein
MGDFLNDALELIVDLTPGGRQAAEFIGRHGSGPSFLQAAKNGLRHKYAGRSVQDKRKVNDGFVQMYEDVMGQGRRPSSPVFRV